MATPALIHELDWVENEFGRQKLVVAGTKITVHEIAEMVEHGTATIDWILENFNLTRAQVHAALSYYYAHQVEIDAEIEATNADVRQRATDAHQHLDQMRTRPQKTAE
jgi:uncharacterized protein (DUF433 family)